MNPLMSIKKRITSIAVVMAFFIVTEGGGQAQSKGTDEFRSNNYQENQRRPWAAHVEKYPACADIIAVYQEKTDEIYALYDVLRRAVRPEQLAIKKKYDALVAERQEINKKVRACIQNEATKPRKQRKQKDISPLLKGKVDEKAESSPPIIYPTWDAPPGTSPQVRKKMNEWSKWLHGPDAKRQMPHLFSGKGKVSLVAPGTKTYNCFAASVGVFDQWIPVLTNILDPTQQFKPFYDKHGYKPTNDNNTKPAPGVEKIALLRNDNVLTPQITHAAVQLRDGRWLHKLGEGPMIITDNIDQVMGADFGSQVASVFTRKRVARQYAPKGFRIPHK